MIHHATWIHLSVCWHRAHLSYRVAVAGMSAGMPGCRAHPDVTVETSEEVGGAERN